MGRASQQAAGASVASGRAAAASGGAYKTLARDALAVGLGVGALSVGAQALRASFRETIGGAIEFESSFAGIRKTVDATEADFQELARSNRLLAREIPASVNAINRVGELAGQLGIDAVDDIKVFERTILDLSNTTDLTAESAAVSFAQIANIVKLPRKELANLGSAVVALGNNSATVESEIVDFTQRIAGAGQIAGLTVAQIAGIGAAVASVGVQAEAGGTAIQKVLIAITRAAAEGGDELEVFAKTAGLSADAFQKLFRADPAEAFVRFVEGLGKAGDEAFAILGDLSLEDQRLLRTFLGTAGAGDLLRRSIDLSSQAFIENTALTAEAEKRYATTASQLKILQNNLADVGITIGNTVLPAINQSAQGAGVLVDALRPLGPLFRILTTAALAYAAALLAIKAANLAASLGASVAAGNTLGGAMSGLALKAGLAAAGFVALDQILQRTTGEGIIGQFTLTKERADAAAAATKRYGNALEDLNQLTESGIPANEAFNQVLRQRIEFFEGSLAAIDAARGKFEDSPSLKVGGQVIIDFSPSFSNKSQDAKEDLAAAEEAAKKLVADMVALAQAGKGGGGRVIEIQLALDKAGISAERFNEILASADIQIGGQSINNVNELSDALGAIAQTKLTGAEAEFQGFIDTGAAGADVFKLYAKRADDAAKSTEGIALAANKAREEQKGFTDALDEALGAFDFLDPTTESLRLNVLQLEQQKRAAQAAGQATDVFDDRIKDANLALEEAEGRTALAKQATTLFGAALVASGHSTKEAGDLVRALGNRLELLPPEERIKIAMALPTLEMNRLLQFLELISTGQFTVDIALRISSLTPQQLTPPDVPFLGGGSFADLPGAASQKQKAFEQALRDIAFKDATSGARKLSEEFAGAGASADKTGKSADRLTRVLQAASDGIIDLAEATELGITEEEAAVLQLAVARNKEADEAFRSRVALRALAIEFPGMSGEAIQLALALRAIDQHLRETGKTINQFIHDTAADALEGFRSAFQQLFSRPTKEAAQAQLKLAQLELTRIRRRRAGATDEDLEALDKEIERVQLGIQQREKEFEIIQLKNTLADQSIITDRDLMEQAQLLTTAIHESSGEMKKFESASFFDSLAHINAGNAANEFAAAARGAVNIINGTSTQPVVPFGGAGAGGMLIDHPMHIIAGEGFKKEILLPLESPLSAELLSQLPTGLTGTRIIQNTFAPALAVEDGMSEAEMEQWFASSLQRFFQQSRSRSQRAGATISSSVG